MEENKQPYEGAEKVYVLTEGSYSDYGIVAMFSSKEKLNEFMTDEELEASYYNPVQTWWLNSFKRTEKYMWTVGVEINNPENVNRVIFEEERPWLKEKSGTTNIDLKIDKKTNSYIQDANGHVTVEVVIGVGKTKEIALKVAREHAYRIQAERSGL